MVIKSFILNVDNQEIVFPFSAKHVKTLGFGFSICPDNFHETQGKKKQEPVLRFKFDRFLKSSRTMGHSNSLRKLISHMVNT